MSKQRPRVVVVTGASSGIGLAAALQSADAGDHVVLIARGVESLASAVTQCQDRGAASARALPTDVGDAAAVEAAIATVVEAFGRVDVVLHSAGLAAYGRFEEVPTEVFDTVVRTNLLGTANVARAVLPGMRDRNAGSVILIGSLLGGIAPPYMAAYSTSKWGVRGLARILQVENRDHSGVQISHVSPGGIDTPIYLQSANYLGWVGRPPPPVVTPEKVAQAALRLIDHPRPRIEVGAANRLALLGFNVLPGVYDRMILPLFEAAATDIRHRLPTTTGNAHHSVADGNRLRGEQDNPLISILGGLRARLGRRRR